MRARIDMAADRGAFIDQSQSFNVFVQDPNYGKLSSMHFYGWKKGLKTGMYYLRTKAAAAAIQFTVGQGAAAAKADGAEAESAAAAQRELELHFARCAGEVASRSASREPGTV